MAVTRLERKGRRNKLVAKQRKSTIKGLTAKPVIKNIDIEEIKAEFAANAESQKPKKEAPKDKVEEVAPVAEATAEAVVEEKAPEKKPAAKKEEVEKEAAPKAKKEAAPEEEAAPKKEAKAKKEDKGE
jgi:hypothetical protein